jgi:hypothetical protein
LGGPAAVQILVDEQVISAIADRAGTAAENADEAGAADAGGRHDERG